MSRPRRAPRFAAASAGRPWSPCWPCRLHLGSTYLAIRVVVTMACPLLSMGVRFVAGGPAARCRRSGSGRGRGAHATRRQLARRPWWGSCCSAAARPGRPGGAQRPQRASPPAGVDDAALDRPPRARPSVGLGPADVAGPRWWASPAPPCWLGRGASGSVAWQGVVLILVATACLGHRLAVLAPARLARHSFAAAAYQMLFRGRGPVVGGLVLGEAARSTSGPCSASGWWALAYLVVVGSMAYTAYFWLLRTRRCSS